MSRHYGTIIEPDNEPDTLEPDDIDVYNSLFWEPEPDHLSLLDEAFYQTHTKDGRPVEHDNEKAEYLEER